MRFLLIFFFSLLSSCVSSQWIDPHDMNTNSKRNLKKSSSTGSLEQHCNCPEQKEYSEETNSLIYLKRVVNLLLTSASADQSDPTIYHSKLSFTLDNKSVQFLRDFTKSDKVNLDQLRKLDTILSDVFHKRYLDDAHDILVSATEKIYMFVFSKNSLPLIGLCVFLYIAYNLFQSNFSIWYVLRYFIFLIILIDFIQRYQQLTEEAEEHNMHLKYSAKCDTNKMSWGQYLKFLASKEDCEIKVVSLLEVGLLQVKHILIIPLGALGKGMGQFGEGLWTSLPFPWNILIFPIMLIFCIFLVVILMTSVNGTPFKVNLMHLFHFEFGEKKNVGIGNTTLDKLIDIIGRPMVQDVREKRKERSPQKGKNSIKAIEKKKTSPNKKSSSDQEKSSTSNNKTDKSLKEKSKNSDKIGSSSKNVCKMDNALVEA